MGTRVAIASNLPVLTGARVALPRNGPTRTVALSDEEVWQNWRDACLANDGETTLPEHAVDEFWLITNREGANHGMRNENSEGSTHNQVSVPDPESGQTLVFNLQTKEPISE